MASIICAGGGQEGVFLKLILSMSNLKPTDKKIVPKQAISFADQYILLNKWVMTCQKVKLLRVVDMKADQQTADAFANSWNNLPLLSSAPLYEGISRNEVVQYIESMV